MHGSMQSDLQRAQEVHQKLITKKSYRLGQAQIWKIGAYLAHFIKPKSNLLNQKKENMSIN